MKYSGRIKLAILSDFFFLFCIYFFWWILLHPFFFLFDAVWYFNVIYWFVPTFFYIGWEWVFEKSPGQTLVGFMGKNKISSMIGRYSIFLIIITSSLYLIHLTDLTGAITNFKLRQVKTNMHILQSMVETYAVDWNGYYPGSVEVLKQDAQQKNYWKELTNPFLGRSGRGKSYGDEWASVTAGIVTYDPSGVPISRYFIYGYNQRGKGIKQGKGGYGAFYLTNS